MMTCVVCVCFVSVILMCGVTTTLERSQRDVRVNPTGKEENLPEEDILSAGISCVKSQDSMNLGSF